jgi:hypothetical protein
MKTYTKFLFTFITIAVISVNGCAQSPTLIATPESPTATTTLAWYVSTTLTQLGLEFREENAYFVG